MTNELIAEKLDLMFTSLNEMKVSVAQIEVEIKHVIDDKLKTIEKEIEHQKTVRASMYQRIEALEQAPQKAAKKTITDLKSLITKILLTSLILLLFGIVSRYVIKEIKEGILKEAEQTTARMFDNNVAILPKLPKDPTDDGEYCEGEEEKKEVDK